MVGVWGFFNIVNFISNNQNKKKKSNKEFWMGRNIVGGQYWIKVEERDNWR
jgi:hypothetical protein